MSYDPTEIHDHFNTICIVFGLADSEKTFYWESDNSNTNPTDHTFGVGTFHDEDGNVIEPTVDMIAFVVNEMNLTDRKVKLTDTTGGIVTEMYELIDLECDDGWWETEN